MIHPVRAVGYAGVALTLALTGCSSSGNGGNAPTGGGSAPTGGASPQSSGNTDAATTRAVTHAYQVFFNGAGTTAQGVATLQHGAQFRSAIAKEEKSNYGKQKSSASVSTVQQTGPHVAKVTFSIKVGDQSMLPNSIGYAVLEDGHWKVAAMTFCSLLTLEGTAPALCNKQSVIALPG